MKNNIQSGKQQVFYHSWWVSLSWSNYRWPLKKL